jgi:hypothetical protein
MMKQNPFLEKRRREKKGDMHWNPAGTRKNQEIMKGPQNTCFL